MSNRHGDGPPSGYPQQDQAPGMPQRGGSGQQGNHQSELQNSPARLGHSDQALSPGAGCQRCGTPFESGDLRCAVCGLMAPLDRGASVREALQILRCSECGAAVQYVVETKAPQCGFCRAVMHVEKPADPIEQAQYFLPFSFPAEQAAAEFRQWLGSRGFFRPSDLAAAAELNEIRPIAWAAWVVDAQALVSWAADTNIGSRRSQWAPHAGQARLEFNHLVVSASRGLAAKETTALASSYAAASAQPSFNGPPNSLIEQFEAQRSAARREITAAIRTTAGSRLTSGILPGDSHRNLHFDILLEGLRTKRLCFPAYVMAYRYRGRVYRTVLSGQNAQAIVGEAPYSWTKIVAVALGILVLGAVVIALIVVLGR